MQNILLLHGAIGSKSQLDELSLNLKDHFKVHTLNFSGHGGKPFSGSFSIPQFATEVLDYLELNHLDSINIFGYSMGGYVALYFAKSHPEKVSKIFTLGTKFHWTPEIAQNEIKMLNPEKILEKIPAFANELKLRHHPNDWKTVLLQTAEMMIYLGNNNPLTLQDFSEVEIPVSLNIGENDAMVSIEETEMAYKNLPNAKLHIFPAAAHPIEKVNTGELAVAILNFLK